MMAGHGTNWTRRHHNAFTLVELMVVVVIILLLVGLLMPVLNRARLSALSAADAGLINQIAMGCESYNEVFHEYPASAWAPAVTSTDVAWPPPPIVGTGIGLPLTGAAKVFAAMSGFNTLADAGWTPPPEGGCNDADPANWVYPCGELTHRGILKSFDSPYTSEDKVYGPYYDPSSKQQTLTYCNWNNVPVDQTVFASRFSRLSAHRLTTGAAEQGAPILYYRANLTPAGSNSWQIFSYQDNFPITDPASAAAGIDPTTIYDNATPGHRHPLYGQYPGKVDVDNAIAPTARITEAGSLDYGISHPPAAAGQTWAHLQRQHLHPDQSRPGWRVLYC